MMSSGNFIGSIISLSYVQLSAKSFNSFKRKQFKENEAEKAARLKSTEQDTKHEMSNRDNNDSNMETDKGRDDSFIDEINKEAEIIELDQDNPTENVGDINESNSKESTASSDSDSTSSDEEIKKITGSAKKRKGEKSVQQEQQEPSSDEESEMYKNIFTNSPPTKFKKVDNKSTNRRECLRTKNYEERSDTPEKSNTAHIKNAYYSRVTVKVIIPPSSTPHEKVCSVMQEYFKELLQADENLTILPWKSSSNSSVLDSKSDLPQTITGMTRYCFRAYTPKEGVPATIYPQLLIGHHSDYDDLRQTLQPWLDAKLYGLYYNMLQAEDAKDIGWLLYSTRETDVGALADEITDMIG
jgi:hypothetical protein